MQKMGAHQNPSRLERDAHCCCNGSVQCCLHHRIGLHQAKHHRHQHHHQRARNGGCNQCQQGATCAPENPTHSHTKGKEVRSRGQARNSKTQGKLILGDPFQAKNDLLMQHRDGCIAPTKGQITQLCKNVGDVS